MSASTAYVLSTRPISASLVEEAAAQGVMIDVVPFIGTAKLLDETLSDRIRELTKHPLTVAFTSTNAVMAIEFTHAPDWKIFCISGATQRAATDRFGEHAIAGTAGSARELAETIIRTAPAGELWFFCGDRRREELRESLTAAGWFVHEVVVYQTTLTPTRIEKHYDAIAFFSPSAVESFFSVNTVEQDVQLFAIGETTATALQKKSRNRVSVSEKPDEKILIAQIIKSQH